MAQGQQYQGGRRNGGDRRSAEERQITGAINSFHRNYTSDQGQRKKDDSEHIKSNRHNSTLHSEAPQGALKSVSARSSIMWGGPCGGDQPSALSA